MYKLDKIFLRLAKDTLQLYHAITGKSKFNLANKLLLIGATIEFCAFLILSIQLALMESYIISALILPGTILCVMSYRLGRRENIDTEALEAYAKDNGAMVKPEYYHRLYLIPGRINCWGGIVFMSIPPWGISSTLWLGIFIRGLSYHVVMTEDLPPGKNVFEKIKDKVKSINLAPVTLKPVKVHGE